MKRKCKNAVILFDFLSLNEWERCDGDSRMILRLCWCWYLHVLVVMSECAVLCHLSPTGWSV
jgi:hypothetical protein